MSTLRATMGVALALGWTAAAAAAEVGGGGGDSSAHADHAPRERAAPTEIGVSLLAGFGAGGRLDNDINRYGFGFGGRAGVTLASPRLYLGLSFIRFAGGEDQSERIHTSTLDAEVGYDFHLLRDLVLIRPELGFGVAQAVTIQSDNGGYPLGLHLAPGLLVGIRLRPLLISAELRRDMVPGQWSDAATFLLGAGVVL